MSARPRLKQRRWILAGAAGILFLAEPAWGQNETGNQAALTGGDSPAISTNVAAPATNAPVAEKISPVESRVSTLEVGDLHEYADQPEAVRRLIAQGLALTQLNLSYKYGSDDPKNGGMDCSGTIYYLLQQAGLKDVPRDSGGMYEWVWKEGRFQAVVSSNPKTFELERLRPGDLLFWTGTYKIERDPPVTHVMIYLGTNEKTGRRVMLGASEGRTFDGISRYGVSVFDFKLPGAGRDVSASAPRTETEARFIGYGAIPGLGATGTIKNP